MDKRTLGRTGLEVTSMGMGCGGHSKLGLGKGGDHANAVAIVRQALDLGINIIDSSECYGTEPAIGEAIEGRRDEIVLATKVMPYRDGKIRTPEQLEQSLDQSLRNLKTDVIDVYQVHGARIDIYDEIVEKIAPVLMRMRDKGKIRFTGITEGFSTDTEHKMLNHAVEDDYWDTIMVGFNLMNPSARTHVLKITQEKKIGTFCMFAIRRVLTDPVLARELILDLVEKDKVDGSKLDIDDPLGFLLGDVAGSVAEAGYRFCLHEPGLDVIFSGTGNAHHLKDNCRYLQMPRLPEVTLQKLDECFGHLDCVSCN